MSFPWALDFSPAYLATVPVDKLPQGDVDVGEIVAQLVKTARAKLPSQILPVLQFLEAQLKPGAHATGLSSPSTPLAKRDIPLPGESW